MTEQTYTHYRLDPDYRFDTLDQKLDDLSRRSAGDVRELESEIAKLGRETEHRLSELTRETDRRFSKRNMVWLYIAGALLIASMIVVGAITPDK